MQPRISMISLGVADLGKATLFYQQGLGLPRLQPYKDNITFFDLKGSWLGLYPWHKLAADAGVDAAGAGYRGMALAHNLHSMAEVDALMAQAVSAGATMIKQPQEVFWGGYAGYFADLDGHMWELVYNPYAWVGPED